jgi:hypothetical protein
MKTNLLGRLAERCRQLAAIDLGRQVPDYSLQMNSALVKPESKLPKRTDYPSLMLWEAPEATWEMPGEGKAVVTYRVVSREKRESREEGKAVTKHSLTLEIQDIEPMEKKGKSKGSGVSAKGMDLGAVVAVCRELRLRAEDGSFVPNSAGAADPMAHAAAYEPVGKKGVVAPQKKRKGAAAYLARVREMQ